MNNIIKPLLLTIFLSFLLLACNNDDNLNDDLTDFDNIALNAGVEIYNPDDFERGYTLVAPLTSKNAYLINMEGFPVKAWTSEYLAISNYLNEQGEYIRSYAVQNNIFSSPGTTGGIEIYNFEGELIWNWTYSTPQYSLHHDLEFLPNGNILASVWDYKTKDEAIENGRNPNLLFNNSVWPDRIIEIKRLPNNQAEIVWEWSFWDHLVQDHDPTKLNFGAISEHPELLDINYTNGQANLNHVNSLYYIEEYDQIVFSSRNFNELFIIDHSTSTLEAQSHSGGNYNKGGDLLFRWGNPQAYKTGSSEDQELFGQHDITFLDSKNSLTGNFLQFNNSKYGTLSSVDEINVPIQSDGSYIIEPNTQTQATIGWFYTNSEVFSSILSGAQRLQNKNTLITSGVDGLLLEVNSNSNISWKYRIPTEDPRTFKSRRYSIDSPPFNGIELEVLNIPIE